MDMKFIFKEIANKLMSEFKISSQMKHQGIIGDYREDALKDFLMKGRIPRKFSIGSSEIIGPNSNIHVDQIAIRRKKGYYHHRGI
ncbi:hypothetical protein MNQ98_13660 [Paenibacillus sp. N3/727]|uniref:DUF6602 domain-containing protein n=1 Tax=Paenibacillus sp. N3/727 TaxID=2925845 RepID=UPI001F537A49|nr:DUF6602 domain-containing protein [Paenibacillus sp. N3/727]UNK20992.1 hypothetical protein MNQ98_13660 [Paenibacillus sp. N3/727]